MLPAEEFHQIEILGDLHHHREGEDVDGLFPVAESLYGEDVFALQTVGIGNAGTAGLALNEDRTGTAGTFTTAVLGG